MRTRLSTLFILSLLLLAGTTLAQSSQTWVSGDGDDTDPCSYTSPCRTFSGAITKTATGGIISVQDPGPYAGLTITKSITIDGGGTYASVLHTGGSNGIIINLTSNDTFGNTVVLRGLSFGSDLAATGVRVVGTVATELHIADCDFTQESTAISMQPGAAGSSLSMSNVDISRGGSRGIYIDPPTSGTPFELTLDRVRVSQTANALEIDANTVGTISDSLFTASAEGVHIDGTTVHVNLVRTVLSENSVYGLRHMISGIATLIDECSIFGNGTGISNTGGTVLGFFDNSIANNVQDVSGNAVQSLLQQ